MFILGASRSGTTLLRLMFNSHPLVCVPSESRFLSQILDRIPVGKVLSKKDLDHVEEILLSHESWPHWNISHVKLLVILEQNIGKTVRELMESIFTICCEQSGKQICGEKTPHHCFYSATFAQLFPSAKFIHLIRDGRGATEAMYRRKWYDKSILRIARHWSGCVQSVWSASKAHPGRFKDFHYEELVKNPCETLQEMCSFLGIPYSDDLMSYRENLNENLSSSDTRARGIHEKLHKAPDATESEKWQSELSARQIFLFEAAAGSTNKEAGYTSHFASALQPVLALVGVFLGGIQKGKELMSRLPIR